MTKLLRKNMKISKIIIFIILIFLGMHVMAKDQWVKLIDIGEHIDFSEAKEETINKAQAVKIFQKNDLLTKDALTEMKKIRDGLIKKNKKTFMEKNKKDNSFFLDTKYPISIEISRISKTKVNIYILFVYGHSRWHSFYMCIKNYIIKRDADIDEIFNLKELEENYFFSFKGIGHGTAFEYMEKKLGKNYYEYLGQSPQLRNIYYEKYNIEVVIQDFVVKKINKGRPGWMDSGMIRKNVN